jgi:MFS family permease
MTGMNRYYILAITIISCGGIPKGYDEGGYSSSITLPSFTTDFDLVTSHWKNNPSGLANRKANITSFGVLGAALGALIALHFNDLIGRLWSWRAAVLLWASGVLMEVFASGRYGFLLFARIWMGLGAGALTAVSPMFLSEIAGTKARGLVVSSYMAMLLLWFAVGMYKSTSRRKFATH